MERPLALVVDGDGAVRRRVREIFERAGVEVLEAASGPSALDRLEQQAVDVVVLDLQTPDTDEVEIVRRASAGSRQGVVVIVTPDDESASRATRSGAYDAVPGSADPGRLEAAVRRALDRSRLLAENANLRTRLRRQDETARFIGRGATMEQLTERLRQEANLDAPTLFRGEEGSGRRWAAHFVHDLSERRDRPFLSVHCAGRPPDVIEAELFGSTAAAGALVGAADGSVLLAEVDDLPLAVQDRLLRALLEGSVSRSGTSERTPVRARLLSTARGNPTKAAREGRMREELARRVSAGVVEIPTLRERSEEILGLARHFIAIVCEMNQLPPYRLSSEVAGILEGYSWPGNVRELRNAIEHAVIVAREQTIRPDDLPESVRRGSSVEVEEAESEVRADRTFKSAKREIVESFEKKYLVDLMRSHGGNVTAAAQTAGMLRSALQRLLRKYDIRSATFRKPGTAKPPETRA
jgi:DNA-binding NtrC family response regulator